MKTLLVFLTTAAVGAAACNSATVSTAPSPSKCQVSVSAPSGSIGAGGGAGAVTVSTQAECAWTAASDVGWITGLNPASGQGAGEVRFTVSANPAQSTRQGRITLNGVVAQVTQAGAAPSCQVAISAASQSMGPEAGTGALAVTAPGECSWAAASSVPWLIITSGHSGAGNGTIAFTVTANSGAARLGALSVANQTFVLTQSAVPAPQCSSAIQQTSASLPASGGNTVVSILAGASCSWTAAGNVSWLTVTGAALGSGNGSVTITAQANTGGARSGTATIAGQTFTVNQAGSCLSSLAINPTSQQVAATAGNGSAIAVTAPGGCAWTSTASTPWITLTGGAAGSGNGSVTFSVSANTGSSRTGTITIGGQTHTVTQAGTCSTSIAPPSQTVSAAGGAATSIAVAAAPGCNWTAASSQTWLTITSGASGSGNGTVALSAAANTGPQRTATVTVAGQTHTVTQTTGCSYSISPTTHSLDQDGQTPPAISVTTVAGCTWTAVSNDSWITVQSGASGTGSGSVTYKVTKNNGSTSRTGTLTIAGRTFTVVQDH